MTDAGLVEAARFERDRRLELAERKITEGGDAETIATDCQCWIAIAEWLDSGVFAGFYGGAEPQRDDAPWISWPDLAAAAARALTRLNAKIDGLEGAPTVEPETLGALRLRRSCLATIHRKLQLRRQLIDSINAEFRAERTARTQGEGIAA